MKPLLFTLLACFFTACASAPKGPYYAAPTSPGDYRLVHADAPVSKKAPQVFDIPASDAPTLERVRPKIVELQAAKPPLPEIGSRPAGYGHYLQGAEAGKWRSLAIVDYQGQLVQVSATPADDSTLGPKIKDPRATRVLKKYVQAMQKESAAGTMILDKSKLVIVIKPGFVKSPYHPSGGPIDVRGLPSGTEVEDPYMPGHTFIVP